MQIKAECDPTEDFRRKIYETENDVASNIKCQVCLRYAFTPDDQIILCDFCKGAVHQKCYGAPIESKIPKSYLKFLH